MKKIKVMNMIYDMGDGGAQRILLNYLKDFKDDKDIDFKLFVYKGKKNSYCNRVIEQNGLNVEYLNGRETKLNIPFLRFFINNYIASHFWDKAIKSYKPDIVHVHISELLCSTLKPIISNNVAIKFDTLHSNPLRYKGKKLRYVKKAFHSFDFIPICVTNEQAILATNHYGIKRYEVVRNGIDIDLIKSKIISKLDARKKYGLNSKDFVIIGVGRLNVIKRFDFLIKVFNIYQKNNENAKLLIAGDGPEKKKLMKLVESLDLKEKVFFLGNLDDVISLYCAADMHCVTSKSESASLTLLETQICGLKSLISSGVPIESVFSDLVSQLPENSSINDWANEIDNFNYIVKKVCCKKDYDVQSCSKNMKNVYLKYYEELKNEK